MLNSVVYTSCEGGQADNHREDDGDGPAGIQQPLPFGVQNFGLRIWSFGLGASGLGLSVWDFGLRARWLDFGFRVRCLEFGFRA